MAHYIAELITETENSKGKSRDESKKKCCDTILALWRHRSELPNGKRPFEEIEPVVRAIQSLDPNDDTPRHFRSARPPKREKTNSEMETWLKLADGIDYSAKLLIGAFLAEAARASTDSSKTWAKLAEKAGVEDGVSEIVLRFVSPTDKASREPSQKSRERKQLQNRLSKLEGFVKLAQGLADDWNGQLKVKKPTKHQRSKSKVTK